MTETGISDGSPAQDAESHFSALVRLDIVQSTETLKGLSRPDHLDLVKAFRAAINAVLPVHDVKVEWDGDGALIVFGYPKVRVDVSEAAVQTALKLVEAVRAIRAIPGVRLELRVGIASGVVSIDSASGALAGMAINRAERIRAEARPGQILVAADTRRLAGNFFEYEDLGIVTLRDFGDTHLWRVVRETSIASRFAAQRLNDASMEIVGRLDVLERLVEAWSESLEGRGAGVCLVGDAGMGKSRLARTVLERAARDGGRVLEIDCAPSSGNSPLLPIGVLLRRTAGIRVGASDSEKEAAGKRLLEGLVSDGETAEAWSYMAPLFGVESAPIPLDKTREQVRAATIATIVRMVQALARQQPLALLCEDLHWADDSTAQVVQSIAAAVRGVPALLVVTRWPRAVTPIDLDGVTAEFTTIAIEPLSESNAAELVRAVAGDELTPERVDAIVSRCGGVPLLLEEVTRSILEASDQPASLRSQRAYSSVPPELQLIVESRLARWPQLKGIIEAASVLGREFPIPVLEAMLPGRRTELPEALSTFVEHGLFAPLTSGARASFRHALIRDAVYETLVSNDYLQLLHSRAADTLMARYAGTPDAALDVLAQHLQKAARFPEAIRVHLSAGEETFKRAAYIEAQGHCDAISSLLDRVNDRASLRNDEFQAHVLRGMVATGIDGYSAQSAEAAYRTAQMMFDDSTDPALRYPVLRGLATAALVRGELATAYQYSQEGLELAEQSGRVDFQIDAMSVRAYTTLYFDRLEDARTWIDRCLALYDAESGSRFRYPVPQDAKTAALALLPTAAWLLGDADGADEAIARGVEHVETLGRDFDKALLHAWTAGTLYTQRRYVDAERHARIAHAIGKEHRFQEWEGVGRMMLLLARSAQRAEPDCIVQAINEGQQFQAKGIGLNGPYFLWGIARGLVVAGDIVQAGAFLTFALDVAAASPEARMKPEIWMLKAEIESDPAKARQLLVDAYRLAQSQGAVANALRAAAMLLTTAEDPAACERARTTLDRLDGRQRIVGGSRRWMHDDLVQLDALLEASIAPRTA